MRANRPNGVALNAARQRGLARRLAITIPSLRPCPLTLPPRSASRRDRKSPNSNNGERLALYLTASMPYVLSSGIQRDRLACVIHPITPSSLRQMMTLHSKNREAVGRTPFATCSREKRRRAAVALASRLQASVTGRLIATIWGQQPRPGRQHSPAGLPIAPLQSRCAAPTRPIHAITTVPTASMARVTATITPPESSSGHPRRPRPTAILTGDLHAVAPKPVCAGSSPTGWARRRRFHRRRLISRHRRLRAIRGLTQRRQSIRQSSLIPNSSRPTTAQPVRARRSGLRARLPTSPISPRRTDARAARARSGAAAAAGGGQY